ncbi:hypothetical protein B0H14DRAFT_3148738 [Mycena olivaceomarginata]|nr:hypothetical protein B0H14DRAFT_3148738 [Mycena olivaceomarginata]
MARAGRTKTNSDSSVILTSYESTIPEPDDEFGAFCGTRGGIGLRRNKEAPAIAGINIPSPFLFSAGVSFGASTRSLGRFDPDAAPHSFDGVDLNLALVKDVLSTTYPSPSIAACYFTAEPSPLLPLVIKAEGDYYLGPASEAVNAVRDRLREMGAGIPHADHTCMSAVDNSSGEGAPHILCSLYKQDQWSRTITHTVAFMPTEFKCAKVLFVEEQCTLDFLEDMTSSTNPALTTSPRQRSRARRAVSCHRHTVNHMAKHTIGHAVMATEERYVLLRLTETLQLEMSRVYQVSGSPTQARDIAALVLFYGHAAVGAGTRYVGWAPLNARWMARARASLRRCRLRLTLRPFLHPFILPEKFGFEIMLEADR